MPPKFLTPSVLQGHGEEFIAPSDEQRDLGPVLFTRAEVSNIRPESREVDVVASTESLDSHGTVLRQNWRLDRYLKNPVVLFGHDRESIPVATAKNVKVQGSKTRGDRRLTATFKFRDEGKSAHADEVWGAVEDGTLKGISVGFRSHSQSIQKENDQEFMVLDDNELFEISVVSVPSNADTLANMRARAFESLSTRISPPDTLGIKQDNTMDPKILARALGLSEVNVTDDAINGRIATIVEDRTKLLTATGEESLDSALAVIAAGRQAITSLETERKNAAIKEREVILVQLRADNKVTPAFEAGYLATLDLEGLRTFAKYAPPIAILIPSTVVEGTKANTGAPDRKFEQLTSIEKSALKKDDPESYNQLRNDWIGRGRPTK